MDNRKVYLDKHTNLLQLEEHMYPLVDVDKPNVFRNLFHYDEIPKVAFNDRIVPHSMPDEIWITDTTFRDGQQSRAPYSTEQIVRIYDELHRLGGPNGKIRQSEFFLYSKKDRDAVYRCLERGYQFPEVTSWIRASKKDFELVKDIGMKETGILVSCSDYHIFYKLKMTRRDILTTKGRVTHKQAIDKAHAEYEKYRIDNLVTSINMALDNLYQRNEEELTKAFIDLYYKFDKEASIDLGVSFNAINENLIREVIKTKWSGLSFSERIWEHRRRLALTIKEELTKGLTRGDSLQDISRIISDKFNTSYSNTIRLVRTESCWVMNEATVNNYKENGIKEYEFMAFLDKKTSPQCRELDGKIISISEYKAGVNFPPVHPNCRSCIVPVIE